MSISKIQAAQFFCNGVSNFEDVLLIYSVEQCPPCLALEKLVEDAIAEGLLSENQMIWVEFENSARTLEFMKSAGVRHMPSMMYFKDQELKKTWSGFIEGYSDLGRLSRWLSEAGAGSPGGGHAGC